MESVLNKNNAVFAYKDHVIVKGARIILDTKPIIRTCQQNQD